MVRTCSAVLVLLLAAANAAPTRTQTGTINDIKHIVIFMQENRAFDHYYGNMKGVRGFNDRAAPTLPNGNDPFHQPIGRNPPPENFCGCSACDFDWKNHTELKTMLLGLPCQALVDLLGSADPPVSVSQGESCQALIKEVSKTVIDHLNVSDAIGAGASCAANLTVTGLPGLSEQANQSYLLPYPLMFEDTSATCMPAPEMDYNCNIRMWNGGNVDGWNTQRDPGFGMSYFNRTDLDYYYALGDGFTVGDQYFQSTYTATCPNREHLFTGSNGLSVEDSGFCLLDDSEPAGLKWETMAETLMKGNISWKVYQSADNFDDNGFAWFDQFKQAKPGEPLYDLGMARQPDFVQTFSDDVGNDTLPQVSWIVGPAALSEHATNHPVDGMDLSARLIAVLQANPSVYAKTAFILNYDEGGQFYDHHWAPAVPRTAEDGESTITTQGELTLKEQFEIPAGNPIGLGWRVPLFIISPWTRAQGGLVFSQVSDHTSTIQFIEKRFGVRCPNISPWRRSVTSDLTAAFDFTNPDYSWPTFPSTKGDVNASKHQCEDNPPPVVPSTQTMPSQEPGTKLARALPYEFNVTDSIQDGVITITIANTGNSTGVFNVYNRVLSLSTPKTFTVEPGKSVSPTWRFKALGHYKLDLHGPNGFVRKFAGSRTSTPSASLEYDISARAVHVHGGDASCGVHVVDSGYGLGRWSVSGTPLTVSLESTGNWYDLTVTSDCDPSFSRRFMGRMETGETSITDPAMAVEKIDTEEHPLVPEELRYPQWDPVQQCLSRRSKMKDACWELVHMKEEL